MVRTSKLRRTATRDSYLALIREFPLASIKTDRQLKAAQEVVDRILKDGIDDDGTDMYLEALSDLVSRYEDDHHAIAASEPVAVLRHLMEANDVSQVALHRETGIAKSNISEVLSGKRSISRSQMGKLAEYFHVSASVFLGRA